MSALALIGPTLKWQFNLSRAHALLLGSFNGFASPINVDTGLEVRFIEIWDPLDVCMDHSHELLSFDSEEIAEAEAKLKSAIDMIRGAGRELENFFFFYTRRIELIKSPTYGVGTTSTGDRIFRTIIRNINARDMVPINIAEGLIHEAIHSFLNIVELRFPIFHSTANRAEIWSKWTGNRIDYYSLPHACLVWYGLVHFYKTLGKRGLISKCLADRAVARCAHGFKQGGGILVQLGAGKSDIAPFYLELIERIQNEVRFSELLPRRSCGKRRTLKALISSGASTDGDKS